MRGVSALQVSIYVVLLVIGVGAGYALAGAAAQVKTETVTVSQQGVVTQTVKVTTTEIATVTRQAAALSGEIPIGALLALSGAFSAEGAITKVGAELAIEDLNSYAKSLGLPITFKLLVEDSATDPTTALQKTQALYAKGVKAIVGFSSSPEVRAVKSYADSNKIVICSYGSVASDLSLPDYVFRLVPPDRYTGKALARLMYDYGVRYVYIIYVNDAWGSGFAAYVNSRFKDIGGSVIDMVGYDPKKNDFSAELATAAPRIKEAINSYGSDKVAVLVIGREEVATIASQAESYPELMSITWFGTDGTALNSKIIEVAGKQLATVKLISPIFAPTESPKYVDFANRFRARVGENPGTWPALTYDCTMLVGLSIIEAGKYDGEAIKNALPLIAKRYFGASGWTLLDDNGDRAGGNYDAWAVVMKDGKATWERVAAIDVASDTVSWIKRI